MNHRENTSHVVGSHCWFVSYVADLQILINRAHNQKVCFGSWRKVVIEVLFFSRPYVLIQKREE
jgi:hypothetical protein